MCTHLVQRRSEVYFAVAEMHNPMHEPNLTKTNMLWALAKLIYMDVMADFFRGGKKIVHNFCVTFFAQPSPTQLISLF